MEYTHKDLFEKVRIAQKAMEDAKIIAESINEQEGLYYSDETYTTNVLERYFMYNTHKDIEDYWYSSSATC